MKKSPKVDDYIHKLPDFSKKILTKLRALIHKADPEIAEDLRWGSPTFFHEGMVCLMWGMKSHTALIFTQGALMKDSKKLFNDALDNKKSRSIKITDVSEIDEKGIADYIKEAVANNLQGKKIVLKPRAKKPVVIPIGIKKRMTDNLINKFKERPYYQQRDYLSWIASAKREETQEKRLQQMLDELAEGKVYMGMTGQ